VLRSDGRPTAARAKALNGAAVMAVNNGDPSTAKLCAEEALVLHRTLGDMWGAAYSGFMLGSALGVGGDPARAQPLYEESVRVFRELGDEHSAVLVSRNLAATYDSLGDRQRARALYEENLRRARATSNERMQASMLGALATIALEEGRLEDADTMLKERSYPQRARRSPRRGGRPVSLRRRARPRGESRDGHSPPLEPGGSRR
jgi:tetratricopeptide (TPR) repeat protein